MSARPRILLVNDTSAESNPGCRAASGVITEMLSRRGKVSVKLPLGYRTESFKSVQGVRKRCVVKRGGYFNSCDNDCTKVDVSGWESVAAQEYGGASELNTLLADVDEVFVNAEGSVHHNFPRALSVLALTRQCIALGKPTYVLNSSIMAMDAELLKCSLEGAAMIHSRESLSADYVSTVVPNVEVVVAPDLAFASIESAQILPLPKQREGVLVTQGVLGTPKQLQFLLPELVSRMGTVSYLTIGDKAENEDFLRICRENGVEEISADTQNLAQLLSMLQQYKVVVSGRHHVNIFC
ncbi:MAG: polysaccharide pyruvyl transferase family protein, partial [Bdellovibrionales bacterium]|nr:polysaccharide pyruvyl transferase family protein [Bdellovibrionales bacterium]